MRCLHDGMQVDMTAQVSSFVNVYTRVTACTRADARIPSSRNGVDSTSGNERHFIHLYTPLPPLPQHHAHPSRLILLHPPNTIGFIS